MHPTHLRTRAQLCAHAPEQRREHVHVQGRRHKRAHRPAKHLSVHRGHAGGVVAAVAVPTVVPTVVPVTAAAAAADRLGLALRGNRLGPPGGVPAAAVAAARRGCGRRRSTRGGGLRSGPERPEVREPGGGVAVPGEAHVEARVRVAGDQQDGDQADAAAQVHDLACPAEAGLVVKGRREGRVHVHVLVPVKGGVCARWGGAGYRGAGEHGASNSAKACRSRGSQQTLNTSPSMTRGLEGYKNMLRGLPTHGSRPESTAMTAT